MVALSEMFYSLQGEGRFAGRPSVFVRLGGCNLRCEGFGGRCDSFYAVDSSYKNEWKSVSGEELILGFEQNRGKHKVDAVITGGEPTLWFGDSDFMVFAEYLYLQKVAVTVETNATREVDFSFLPYKNFVYALSVKLSNSGEDYRDRINEEAINNFLSNAECFFKFVLDEEFISCGKAKGEIDRLREIFGLRDTTQIYCMPLGSSREELSKNAKSVFEFCAREGYCYSDRAHIRIYDKKRGV